MNLVDTLRFFKVVQCNCGFLSVTSARSVFKCRICGGSVRMVKKPSGLVMTHFGVKVLFSSDDERECSEFVRLYNKEKYEGVSGFYTYKMRGD